MALSLAGATEALEAAPEARPGNSVVMPPQHASRAYRMAGGEPPHHSPEPRLFSIRA